MERYQAIFEAVQRPENYLNQIKNVLNNKESLIKRTIDKNNLNRLCITISLILKQFNIKIIAHDSQSNLLGISDFATTLPDKKIKSNKIIIGINKYALTANDDKRYIYFIDGLLQTIGHEMIHRLQLHNKVDKEIQQELAIKQQTPEGYQFSKYELMAYAWEIIEEFRFQGKTNEEIMNTMKYEIDSFKFASRGLPEIYKLYIRLFLNNKKSMLNRLHKYMYEYLED